MKPLTERESFVLELFGLEDEDVQSVKYVNLNGSAVVDIFLAPSQKPCPECGCPHPKIKNYILKKITHSVLADRKCVIHYHARRYVCPICGRTYYEDNPFAFKAQKISIKTVQAILADLKEPTETFSSVANRHHISPTTVSSIFDRHVKISRQPLPELINFDEVYAFKSKYSKFVCVLLDYKTGKPIDLLDSRRQDHLEKYFFEIPFEERKKVKACCFDMYVTYRSVMQHCFPNSIGIVDHFHVIQELNRRLDTVRISTMKKYSNVKYTDEYYVLKKFNWLLFKHPDAGDKYGELFDTNRQKVYNHHFKRLMNYYDLREELLKVSPELNEAYRLKTDVADFFRDNTHETAEKALKELINKFRECKVEEMRKFAGTMAKWQTEIINSFIVYDMYYTVNKETGQVASKEIKMSNAIIENRNSIIKTIKKNANGYTNFTRFRNRALYVLDKDAKPLLYPADK